jgi:hypothetical protein
MADRPLESAAMLWARLGHAVRTRNDPWRWPLLATVALDGAPSARVVVLRGVDPAAGLLWLHSDSRAAKVGEIRAEPRVALTFHDQGDGQRAPLQLRLTGEAVCEHDPALLDAAWVRVPTPSRSNYGGAHAPGTPLPDGAGEGAAAAGDRRHFAMLRVQARRMDLLLLGAPHRRAHYLLEGGLWRGEALVP